MKSKIKKILDSIARDREKGLVPLDHDIAMVQVHWLKIFGSPGISHYPYLNLNDMISDLKEEVL